MSIIILTIGIPGSGKTYWTNEFIKKHKNNVHIISTDALRKEITGVEQCIDPSQNDMIHDEAHKRVSAIINNPNNYGGNNGFGPMIIVDSTNVEKEEWERYKKLNPTFLVAKFFDIPPEIAMKNQMKRERKVPFEVLKWKWGILQENLPEMKKFFNFILSATSDSPLD